MFFGNKAREAQWTRIKNHKIISGVSSYVWNLISVNGKSLSFLANYVNKLVLPFSSASSILGFLLLITIALQLLSGFFLAWYYIPETGLVIELREEMFEETRFGYEVFSMHVKGVDVIFFLSYLHIVKKLYLKNYVSTEADGWILGGYAFLWFHYVVGLGICLSATHLSDLTLTIAANVFWSLTDNLHKTFYIFFTNKHLNVDQLVRLMLFHYFAPWYYIYLVKLHVMFCHEAWDSDSSISTYEDKSNSWISWFYDGLAKELQDSWYLLVWVFSYFFHHHYDIDANAYFFFERWNIAELDEIRFYGVSPHWYFKPLMGLLTIAPTHYEGLSLIGLFFILLTLSPVMHNLYNASHDNVTVLPMKSSRIQTFFFFLFMISLYTTASLLPCGRYYYEPEGGYVGNTPLKWSYQYIYFYLGWLLFHLDRLEYRLYTHSTYMRRSTSLLWK